MSSASVKEERVQTRGRGSEQRRLEKRALKKQADDLLQARDEHLEELTASLGSVTQEDATISAELCEAQSRTAMVSAETRAAENAIAFARQDASEMNDETKDNCGACAILAQETHSLRAKSGALYGELHDKLEVHKASRVAVDDKRAEWEHLQTSIYLYESLASSCDRNYEGMRQSMQEVQVELVAAELRTAQYKMMSETNQELTAEIKEEAREAQEMSREMM